MKIKEREAKDMNDMLRYAREGEKVSVSQFKQRRSLSRKPLYTAEEKRDIVQSYLDGMKIDDIMINYNIAAGTILDFLKEAGYKPNRQNYYKSLSEEEIEKVKDMYNEGYSLKDVAIRYKFSYTMVNRIIKEAGLMRPSPRYKNA